MNLRALFGLAQKAAPDPGRWIVVDVESSGLDVSRDRLLAIAGVALHFDGRRPALACGDSFEVVLRQPNAPVDKSNVLLHGIGVGEQRAGVAPELALAEFERWIGAAPLIGYHVTFDESMIQRAMQATLGRRLPNPWLDLAAVAPVVQPQVKARSLDEWLALRGIDCAVRHQAAADAYATAQLLMAMWPQVVAQRAGEGFRGLAELASHRRWLSGRA